MNEQINLKNALILLILILSTSLEFFFETLFIMIVVINAQPRKFNQLFRSLWSPTGG